MAQIGGNVMLGDLSKFQRVTIVPDSNISQLIVAHTLGIVPKIVIVSCPDRSVVNYKIRHFLCDNTIGTGSGYGGSGGNMRWHANITNDETVNNSYYKLTTDEIIISRAMNSYFFESGETYTVDIYA